MDKTTRPIRLPKVTNAQEQGRLLYLGTADESDISYLCQSLDLLHQKTTLNGSSLPGRLNSPADRKSDGGIREILRRRCGHAGK